MTPANAMWSRPTWLKPVNPQNSEKQETVDVFLQIYLCTLGLWVFCYIPIKKLKPFHKFITFKIPPIIPSAWLFLRLT